jgi:hypothetical protein
MRTSLKLVIALVLCAAAVFAQRNTPLSDSELAAVTARGRMLVEYETEYWHATDRVVALKRAQGTVQRYIARRLSERNFLNLVG